MIVTKDEHLKQQLIDWAIYCNKHKPVVIVQSIIHRIEILFCECNGLEFDSLQDFYKFLVKDYKLVMSISDYKRRRL